MNWYITFVACFLNTLGVCEEKKIEEIKLYEITSINMCFLQAQSELAKWVNEHEGWKIEKFTCGVKNG